MFTARIALVLAALGFATWETVDIFWISTPAAAAVMAVLFAVATIWYLRRDSLRAATVLLLLFVFEAAVAPTLKAMTTKVADFVLSGIGIALAAAVLVTRRRARASRPVHA